MKRIGMVLVLVCGVGLLGHGCGGDDGSSTEDSLAQDVSQDAATDLVDDNGVVDLVPDIPDDSVTDSVDIDQDSGADVEDAGVDTVEDAEVNDSVSDAVEDQVDDDVVVEDFGFEIRLPIEREVLCEEGIPGTGETTETYVDQDWICTFDYEGTGGHVYIQANATGCQVFMSPTPIFTGVGAWWSGGFEAQPVQNSAYDWGGNHHNDSLEFEMLGKRFRYYHSSFGWGWRKCQPMDCIQVTELNGTMVEDGCTQDRTLPAVCQPIAVDGSYDPQFPDNFETCDGDPNFQ